MGTPFLCFLNTVLVDVKNTNVIAGIALILFEINTESLKALVRIMYTEKSIINPIPDKNTNFIELIKRYFISEFFMCIHSS